VVHRSVRSRWVGGCVSALFGAGFLSATLIVMNRKVHKPEGSESRTVAVMDVQKKKKEPPKQKIEKPKPPPRARRPNPAPRPKLSSNLSGLGGSIKLFDVGGLDDLGGDLVGGSEFSKDMVFNEEAVDSPPQPSPGNSPPSYPARARAQGIEGFVKLRLLIGPDGSVQKASVIEAEPQGHGFEDSALNTVRGWQFEPARYKGEPVKMTTELPLRFKLS